ncbi:MAG: ATP-binding protein [Patescibacteria group bacterium]|nr:ATP-binding protein [Patescibacteria group bacterium]
MAQSPTVKNIPIIVDKTHLITIGEKLYSEKIDFIRELVNNAYDADATIVQITSAEDRIVIEDNGSGMDEDGLRQYFTIGSEFKKSHQVSPKLGRERIGEFGIGKFAALAAAQIFVIETQKSEWRYKTVFSKKEWKKSSSWDMKIEIMPKNPLRPNGTTITILNPEKFFDDKLIARHLREKVPLGSPEFNVFLNNKEIRPYAIPGQRIPIDLKTKYGKIAGEIILVGPKLADMRKAGLQIRVRGVMIRRDIFDLESSKGIARIRGEAQANFLPITSSRDDFIRDDERYELFYELVQKEIRQVLRKLTDMQISKFNQQASQILKEALTLVGKAIRKNPDIAENIKSQTPLGEEVGYSEGQVKPEDINPKELAEGFHVSRPKYETPQPDDLPDNKGQDERQSKKKPHAIALGEKTIIRRLRFRNSGVVCRMEHLGKDESESLSAEGIIYINLDHPLYRRFAREERTLIFHVVRLITQEMSLSKNPESPRDAFELQSDLMTEALSRVR